MRSIKLLGVVAATVIFSLFSNVGLACEGHNKHCNCAHHKCHCTKGAKKCKCAKRMQNEKHPMMEQQH